MNLQNDDFLKVDDDLREVVHEYPVLRGHIEGIHQRFRRIKLRDVDAQVEQDLAAVDSIHIAEPYNVVLQQEMLHSSNCATFVQHDSIDDLILDGNHIAEPEADTADAPFEAGSAPGRAQFQAPDHCLKNTYMSMTDYCCRDTVSLGGAHTDAIGACPVPEAGTRKLEAQESSVRQASLLTHDDAHYFPGIPTPPREGALAVPNFLPEPSMNFYAHRTGIVQSPTASVIQPVTELPEPRHYTDSYVLRPARESKLISHQQHVSTGHCKPELHRQQFRHAGWHAGSAQATQPATRLIGAPAAGICSGTDAQHAITRKDTVSRLAQNAWLETETCEGIRQQHSMKHYVHGPHRSGGVLPQTSRAVPGYGQNNHVKAAPSRTMQLETMDWIRFQQQGHSTGTTTFHPQPVASTPSYCYVAIQQEGKSQPGTSAINAVYQGCHAGRAGLCGAQRVASQHSHGQVLPSSFATAVSMNGGAMLVPGTTPRPGLPTKEIPGSTVAHASSPAIQRSTAAIDPRAFALPTRVQTSANVTGVQGVYLPGYYSAPSPVSTRLEAMKCSGVNAPYGHRHALQFLQGARGSGSRYTDSISRFVGQLNSGSGALYASTQLRGTAEATAIQRHDARSQTAFRAEHVLSTRDIQGDARTATQVHLISSGVDHAKVQHSFANYAGMDWRLLCPAGAATHDSSGQAGSAQPSSTLRAPEPSQGRQPDTMPKWAALAGEVLAARQHASVGTCANGCSISDSHLQHGPRCSEACTADPAAVHCVDQIQLRKARPDDRISPCIVHDLYSSMNAMQQRDPKFVVKDGADGTLNHISTSICGHSKHASAFSSPPQSRVGARIEPEVGDGLKMSHSRRLQRVAAVISPRSVGMHPDEPRRVTPDGPEPCTMAIEVAHVAATTRYSQMPASKLGQARKCELPMMPGVAGTVCASMMDTARGRSVGSMHVKVVPEAVARRPTPRPYGQSQAQQPRRVDAAGPDKPQAQCAEGAFPQVLQNATDVGAVVFSDLTQGVVAPPELMRTAVDSEDKDRLRQLDSLAGATAGGCQPALENGVEGGRDAATGEVRVQHDGAEGDAPGKRVVEDAARQDAATLACQHHETAMQLVEGQVKPSVQATAECATLDDLATARHQALMQHENIESQVPDTYLGVAGAEGDVVVASRDCLPMSIAEAPHISVKAMPYISRPPEEIAIAACPHTAEGDFGGLADVASQVSLAVVTTGNHSQPRTHQEAAPDVTTAPRKPVTELHIIVSQSDLDHRDPCVHTRSVIDTASETGSDGVIAFKRYRLQSAVQMRIQKRPRTRRDKEPRGLAKAAEGGNCDRTQADSTQRVTRQRCLRMRRAMEPSSVKGSEAALPLCTHEEQKRDKGSPSQRLSQKPTNAVTHSTSGEGKHAVKFVSFGGVSDWQLAHAPAADNRPLQRVSTQSVQLVAGEAPSRLSRKSILISRRLLPDPRCLPRGHVEKVHSGDDTQSEATDLEEQKMCPSEDC